MHYLLLMVESFYLLHFVKFCIFLIMMKFECLSCFDILLQFLVDELDDEMHLHHMRLRQSF